MKTYSIVIQFLHFFNVDSLLLQPGNIGLLVPYEGQIFNNDKDAYDFYSLVAKKEKWFFYFVVIMFTNVVRTKVKRIHQMFIEGKLFVIVLIMLNNIKLLN